jgi:hypothetical protein
MVYILSLLPFDALFFSAGIDRDRLLEHALQRITHDRLRVLKKTHIMDALWGGCDRILIRIFIWFIVNLLS